VPPLVDDDEAPDDDAPDDDDAPPVLPLDWADDDAPPEPLDVEEAPRVPVVLPQAATTAGTRQGSKRTR
jgi:hypothetical protein